MFKPHPPGALLACLFIISAAAKTAWAGQPLQDGNTTPSRDIMTKQVQQRSASADREHALEELRDTLHNLAGLMDKQAMMSDVQLQAIADVMQRLSLNLHELSQHLAGTGTAPLAAIRERNHQLGEDIEELQLQLNDN